MILSSYSVCHAHHQEKNGETVLNLLFALNLKFDKTPLKQAAIDFLNSNPNPDSLKYTGEKLRWYRYKNNLLQKDVADRIGVDRSTYIHYVTNNHDLYPQDILKKLAKLFVEIFHQNIFLEQ